MQCLSEWNSILDTKNSSRLLQVVPVASSKFIPSEEADGPSVLESHDHLNASFTLGEQHWREKHRELDLFSSCRGSDTLQHHSSSSCMAGCMRLRSKAQRSH